MTYTPIRWDDAAFDVAREVLAKGLMPARARAEIAARLGAAEMSNHALRNAMTRRGLAFTYGAGIREAATGQPPETERSGRVTEAALRVDAADPQWKSAPEEVACRAFCETAPREPGPEDHETVLVLPDMHFTHAYQPALDLALAIGRRAKPTSIVVLGDALDGASLSRHDRTSKVASLMEEVEAARPFFLALDELGARFKLYLLGNHEARLEKFLHTHASAIADVPGLTVDSLLDLSPRGWRVSPYHHGVDIGPVHYTHDVGFCGPTAARQSALKMRRSTVIGHVHTAYTEEIHTHGGTIIGASYGWLGSFEGIDYRHVPRAMNEWEHAVGVMRGGENGWHHSQTVLMKDKSRVAYLDGRALRAA